MKKLILLFMLTIVGISQAEDVQLTWSDNSSNETGFEVERKTPETEFVVIDAVGEDVDEYLDDTVLPGIAYTYRVRAFNFTRYSGYTNEVTVDVKQSKYFTPFEPEDAPTGLAAVQVVGTLIINANNVIVNENETQ